VRWHIGPPPEDPTFSPLPPWRRLREPRSLAVALLLSLPLGVLAAFGLLIMGTALAPGERAEVTVEADRLAHVLVFFVLLISLHELLHAVSFPESLSSRNVVLGIWPRALLFYAHYVGELSRERFLLSLICPFAAISIGSLLLALIDPARSGLWMFAGVLNALSSSMDLLGVLLVIAQLPRGARVRNQGRFTYWRPGAA
jgi:hypothetical protein